VSVGVGEPPRTPGSGLTSSRPRDIVRDVPGRRAVLLGYAAVSTILVGVATGVSPYAGLGALVAVAYGAVVLHRPAIGGITLIAVVPAVSGLKRDLPVPGFRISELLIAGTAALVLLSADRRRRVPWHAFDWIALAYVVATAVLGSSGLISRGAGFTVNDLGTLSGPLQFFLLYRAVAVSLVTPHSRRIALGGLLLASVPVSGLAILQQLGIGGVRTFLQNITGTDIYAVQVFNGETPRATGPFPHWHGLGGFLLLVLLLVIGSRLAGSRPLLPRGLLLAVLAVDVFALVQTVTLSSVFSVVAGALLLGYWMHQLRLVLPALVITGLLITVAAGPLIQKRFQQQWVKPPGSTTSPLVPNTIDFRWQVWTEQYFPALKGHWLTGYGPDRPPGPVYSYAESFYIELILRGGLLLLGIFAALMIAMWGMARRAMGDPDADIRVVGTVVATVVLLLVAIHVISSYFIDSGPPHVLWGLIGILAAGAVDRQRRGGRLARAGPA
jgi:hypothetical protein